MYISKRLAEMFAIEYWSVTKVSFLIQPYLSLAVATNYHEVSRDY
jgi:hypothetical protein